MSTDPVRPSDSAAKPARIGGVSDVDQVREASQAFSLHGVDPMATARYEAMRSRIREGLDAGRSQEAILDDLVGLETRRAFGEQAGDDLRAKVAARFREDPSLRRLFEELMGVVRADSAPPTT